MGDQSALSVALDEFEDRLETPTIPGELPAWGAGVRKTCDEAVKTLKEHIPTWHQPVLDQILREDPELSNRVQQLRDNDASLLRQARQLQAEVSGLAGDAIDAESLDPAAKQDVESFIDKGLAWIIQARKQEAALTAWYQEAFNRDSGVAD